MIASQLPRWMRKHRAQFAARVAHLKLARYAVSLTRFGDDAEAAAQQVQPHVGTGKTIGAALREVLSDIEMWRAFERRTPK